VIGHCRSREDERPDMSGMCLEVHSPALLGFVSPLKRLTGAVCQQCCPPLDANSRISAVLKSVDYAQMIDVYTLCSEKIPTHIFVL